MSYAKYGGLGGGGGGSGTVSSVSVVTANGLAGTVATPTTTPAITLSTTITGLLQGNGTAISAYTGGNLTDVGTDGIVITGGTGAVIGSGTSLAQHVADSTHNGYLSSTDWTTFNSKQASGNYITALTGDVTASGPGSVAATLATVNSNVGSFGSSTAIPSFTVNGKGLITAASTNVVIAPAGTLTGTTLASNVVTSSLTSLGVQSQALNMGSHLINNLTDPSNAQDAATKAYVDAGLAALNPADAVYAASTTNIVGTYLNGVSGVGATFTVTATGALTIDGTTPPVNSRILIKDQSSGFQNGVYNLTVTGSLGISPILTRSLDYNTASDMNTAGLIPVINGTVNALSSWQQVATITTVGTDSLVFTEFTANPSLYLLKANNLSDVASKVTSFNNLSPMTTGGDLIYGGASGTGTRLANGSAGQVLQSNGTTLAPTWTTNISGNAANVTGTVAIANGGTAQTTAAAARAASGLNVESRTAVADANKTCAATDRYIAYTSITAARTVTLPAASAVNAGGWIDVGDESGSLTAAITITIQRAGSDTIDGGTSTVISNPYGRIRFMSNGTNAWYFSVTATGVVMTDWSSSLSFTPSASFGTTTNLSSLTRRVGDTMQVMLSFNNGTTTASNAAFAMPSGYTIDSAKMASNTQPIGRYEIASSGSAVLDPSNGIDGPVFYDGSDTGNVYITYTAASNILQKQPTNNMTNTSGQLVTAIFSIPISGWTSTGLNLTTLALGSLDGQSAVSTGASLSTAGTTLYMQSASATQPGLANTTTQTFAGAKTFSSDLAATSTSTTAFKVNSTSFVVDATNNALGIGTAPGSTTFIDAINSSGATKRLLLTGYGSGSLSGIRSRLARNTAGSPQAVQNGDILGFYNAMGYGATTFPTTATVGITYYAAETFTDSSNQSYIVFNTTPTASVTPAEGMRLTGASNLLIGTTTDSGTQKLQVNGNSNVGTVTAGTWNGTVTSGQSFLTSGTTYTTPSNITAATLFKFTVVGGGGAGGGTSSTVNAGASGGGSAGAGYVYVTGLTASTGYTYAIGAGGTGVSSGTGNNGGNTTLTIGATTYTAAGGTGGAGGGGSATGGAGGTTTNLTIGITGQIGGSTSGSGTVPQAGSGGSTLLGLGGVGPARPGTGHADGSVGTGYGSGGSGGVTAGSSGSTSTGGAGGQGAIIVEWQN